MSDTKAIPAIRKQIRELADGTLRVYVDIDPINAKDFHRLFPEINSEIAIAPIKTDPVEEFLDEEKNKTEHPVALLDAPKLFKKGFFYNPHVLKAIGSDDDLKQWIKRQPSMICDDFTEHNYWTGNGISIPAHVTTAEGKPLREGSNPNKIAYCYIPLTNFEHNLQHSKGWDHLYDLLIKSGKVNGPEDRKFIHDFFIKKARGYTTEWAHKTLHNYFKVDSLNKIKKEEFESWADKKDIRNHLP